MHFGEAPTQPANNQPQATSIGHWLFAIYTAVYAGFVFVSAFRPAWMAKTIGGVNLAVLSGFGLIVGAVLLALLYLWLCRPAPGPKFATVAAEES
jgi:uncharacterized membrane protein (DUF485 family)